MKKRKKKNKKNKKHIFKILLCFLLISFILSYNFYLRDYFINKYNHNTTAKEYKGIISLLDEPCKSVIGNDYAYIKNAKYNFTKNYYSLQIEVNEANNKERFAMVNEELSSKNHPDIVSTYVDNKQVQTDNVIYNKEFIQNIKKEHNVRLIKENEERLVFPLYASFNVIIVNETAFNELGITLPKENWSFANLINTIEKIKKKDKTIIPFDMMISKDSLSYMNFLLDKGYKNIKYSKIKALKKSLAGYKCMSSKKNENDIYYDLYNGKTAIFAGDLNDVNALIRRKNKSDMFNFKVYSYPYEKTKINFANEIKSYMLLNSNNNKKNTILKDFINYIYDNEGENILNIQGKIPLYDIKYKEKDIKYPHLIPYINISSFYSVNDKWLVNHKQDIYENIKNICK